MKIHYLLHLLATVSYLRLISSLFQPFPLSPHPLPFAFLAHPRQPTHLRSSSLESKTKKVGTRRIKLRLLATRARVRQGEKA